MAHQNTPGWTRLEEAWRAGRPEAVREAVKKLSADDARLLEAELGEEAFAGVLRTLGRRRASRKARLGKVVLLHGIMGSELDVRRKGDVDRVWLHLWRIFRGRMADLEMDAAGGPASSGVEVTAVEQNRTYYLRLLLELAEEWDAIPFAYDWREDLSKSAERLGRVLAEFGQGEPVHLVAHSLGGLVARMFIRMDPPGWHSMRAQSGKGSGGRLVMLGTPNRGSYTIPLVLTGGEKQVRMLAFLDSRHRLEDICRIVGTFPGTYQMLPAPSGNGTDDLERLYDARSWATSAVQQGLLDRARNVHRLLQHVDGAERFLYVAGYDTKTPHRVRVDNGRFSYQYTRAGDGRVPHELGSLPGVPTYYVPAAHGMLTVTSDVLNNIHDLLEKGHTDRLPTEVPGVRRAAPSWETPLTSEPTEAEFDAEIVAARQDERREPPPQEQARIERRILRAGDGSPRQSLRQRVPSGEDAPTRRVAGEDRPLEIQVVWGDITKVHADVYAVGHYQDVLPQYAELALDLKVSGDDDPAKGIIRDHTLRRNIRGQLGDIDFFPWVEEGFERATVAIAGMGHPGAFTLGALRVLSRRLMWAISNLPSVETVAMVLIGSGEGTLELPDAVEGLLAGIDEALALGDVDRTTVKRLRIMELQHGRARRILDTLLEEGKADAKGYVCRRVGRVLTAHIWADVVQGAGGVLSQTDAVTLLGRAVGDAPAGSPIGRAARLLATKAARPYPGVSARHVLEAVTPHQKADVQAADPPTTKTSEPTRLSFLQDPAGIRVAAISTQATVSERLLRFDGALLDEMLLEIDRENGADATRFSDVLTRLIMPPEFRHFLATHDSIHFEVDRRMAELPWEMLLLGAEFDGRRPLGIKAQVTRQLRTPFSPPPATARPPRARLRALVIGDPGDPAEGHNLPGARTEALEVRDFLLGKNVEVDALIGAATAGRSGLADVDPATRIAVLSRLHAGGYDILHYSGHGDFDPDRPDRVGWVFSGGLLTAHDLENLEEVPPLIVANACLSGRLSRESQMIAGTAIERETTLLPTLADMFFLLGARDYIGTSWTIDDEGAVRFAKTFYESLLGKSGRDGCPLGQAMRTARAALHEEGTWGTLWAAYHHYGHPANRIVAAQGGT
jgi:pimeloyl-ACP methyl ester carboxylesterase